MIDPTIIDAMVKSGCTAEQLAAVMKADAAIEGAKQEAKKQKARDRFHRWKQRHPNADKRSQTLVADSNALTGGDARGLDKTSNLEIEPQEQKEARKRDLGAFQTWYAAYPHKVQRREAEKAFPEALKAAGSVEALIAGVQRYIATKPPDRAWRNPATWLRGEGWLDAPASVVPMARAGPQQPNLSQIYATQERMENAQSSQPLETSVRYLPAANG